VLFILPEAFCAGLLAATCIHATSFRSTELPLLQRLDAAGQLRRVRHEIDRLRPKLLVTERHDGPESNRHDYGGPQRGTQLFIAALRCKRQEWLDVIAASARRLDVALLLHRIEVKRE
jgi:hypothetical protein